MTQVVTRLIGLIAVVAFSMVVQAQTFRVNDIRVEGLQRVSAGTVFSALPIRVGDTLSDVDIQRAIRDLFRVGLFTDVSIGRDGDVLVLMVKERPAINEITIEGNKVIKTEQLMESLTENGLSEGQIYQSATLNMISQALEREYIGQGRYGASVDLEVEDLPRNQVKVLVTIDEGETARIKKINIIGNSDFSNEELLDLFELQTTGLFSWITGDDKYNKEKLTGDIERVESYYLDRGYLAFSLDSTQVSLSPDKSKVYLTLNIREGDVYTVSEVDLAGDPAIDERFIRRMILMREGQTFSQTLMTTSSEYITNRLGNEGYTFAEVEGIPEPNDEDKTVKVTFFIDPKKRAYVRRINFRGNTATQDHVLRREMRQMEGGSASTAQIEHSKVRLERLGFFKEVNVDTVEVPGVPDQVDVDFSVEEQPSGSMGLQVGYAEYSGLLLSGNIQQNNWFGTGKQVGISASHSQYQTGYNFNYNDPYFTPDGVSRGFSIFYQASDYARVNVAGYSTDVFGGNVQFGYPISDIERLSFDVGFRNLEVKPSTYSVREIINTPLYQPGLEYISQSDWIELLDNQDVSDNPEMVYDTSPIPTDFDSDVDGVRGEPGFLDVHGTEFHDFTANLAWAKSTLNRGILATRGSSQRLGVELALPGGDLEYYKITYDAQWFKPLTRHLTLRLRTNLGWADSYGKTEELPFFEHFYAGGFGSVRGFERNSLGPRGTYAETSFLPEMLWDDRNGDGFVDSGEESGNYGVLCEDPTLGFFAGTTCRPGELITRRSGTVTDQTRSFGGNFLIETSAEVIFPLPFIEDQRSFQAAFFVDAGNVFDTNCGATQVNCFDFAMEKMSVSAGIGLTWISTFGPMTFSLSEALQKNEFDDEKSFNFTLGRSF
ncbi:outer membrane protein assembly factor BamA [Gilvimarinus sp. SDUM040013]|uniref:Outer membrane protein assembly factor BamA n=1 Tax=Gilvimarinus gilvus TaxID=3058038 RepID=A0ABU4S438_9GAMM|nr:outer membrane protein assembly factor BamA [Gilvimarinus sp. SDUM040013]MDO3385785.1 outer membrane protein assembly factor BamA [Gilvimarinus sp. SDUM040013]MDX6850653.1 outer membrane protein assembly factor BamA [Gilvimarinus sp. SDUM040013]